MGDCKRGNTVWAQAAHRLHDAHCKKCPPAPCVPDQPQTFLAADATSIILIHFVLFKIFSPSLLKQVATLLKQPKKGESDNVNTSRDESFQFAAWINASGIFYS